MVLNRASIYNLFFYPKLVYFYHVNLSHDIGQQDDARMNLAVALTASRHGATVVNHVKVVNLLKGLDRVRIPRSQIWHFNGYLMKKSFLF